VFGNGDTGSVAGHRDLITDYTVGVDHIDLTGLDADSGASGTNAFHFLGTAAFDGAAGALHASYDASHNITILEGDTSGDRVADFGIELGGNLTLSNADFTSGSLLLPIVLTGSGTLNGGGLNDTLTGQGGADTLNGFGGDDYLNGGALADTMIGGTGNDTYVVDNAGDVVVEKSLPGFTAPAGWTIKGTADLNNDGDIDVLVSSASANQIWLLHNGAVLSTTDLPNATQAGWTNSSVLGFIDANGDGYEDVLYSYYGAQYAILLNGVTRVSGQYLSGATPDAVQPLTGGSEGIDTVLSSVSYTLPTAVENLTLTSGAGNINGTGNALDNVIIGNEGNNILSGLGGTDTLTGGAGADTFVFRGSFGNATVTDFHSGEDFLQFDRASFATAADVLAHAVDDGHGNAVIPVDSHNAVTLVGITTFGLHTTDFLLV